MEWLAKRFLITRSRKKNQVVTLDTRSSVKNGKESVLIDPQLLFQRLSTIGSRCDDLTDVFKYELCSYPPALFQTTDILFEADKPALAEAIWKHSAATECAICSGWWGITTQNSLEFWRDL